MEVFFFLLISALFIGTLCYDSDSNVSRAEFNALLSELRDLQGEFISLKSECKNQGSLQARDKRLDSVDPIAFSVYLSSTPAALHVYQGHYVVPFDVEILDTSNGYLTSNHMYTIPESGVYVFTWTVVAKHENCAFQLILDSSVIGITYPDSEHDSDNDSATGVVVTRANKGSRVYLRTINACHNLRSDYYARTSFSGWRL